MEKKVKTPTCETCEFYDWDEDYEEYVCRQHMDQDEAYAYHSMRSSQRGCPFYRYHNEYKTVQKQN